MEIEENQAHLIDHFVKQVSNTLTPSSLVNLIVQATSHSSLFAFSEILAVPNVLQVTLLFPILLFFLFFLSNLLLVEIMWVWVIMTPNTKSVSDSMYTNFKFFWVLFKFYFFLLVVKFWFLKYSKYIVVLMKCEYQNKSYWNNY